MEKWEMEAKDRIILASDLANLKKVLELVKALKQHVGFFEVGIKLASTVGTPKAVRKIKKAGGKVFYDTKFKDIPRYVEGAIKAVTRLGVDILTIDSFGGETMMKTAALAAKKEADRRNIEHPLILAVAVLTSQDYDDLIQLGLVPKLNITDPQELSETQRWKIRKLIQRHALLAKESELDGVIASPEDIKDIKEYCGPEFLVFTPGIRPSWAPLGDHKRATTPSRALKLGADKLIIGEPIINPPPGIGTPLDALAQIVEEIKLVKT